MRLTENRVLSNVMVLLKYEEKSRPDKFNARLHLMLKNYSENTG